MWDFVKEATLYINQTPNINAFSACFFLFLGVSNLFIFNRFFTQKQNYSWKQMAYIAVIATITLFTTYFIPIGFNGLNDIQNLVYPWISTSDSLRMKFFLVERVLYIFLLFYLAIAFLSILVHWYVSFEFLKFVFNLEKIKWKGFKLGIFLPIPFFIALAIFSVFIFNEHRLFRFTNLFYNLLIIFFPAMVLLFMYIKRRMKYVEEAE